MCAAVVPFRPWCPAHVRPARVCRHERALLQAVRGRGPHGAAAGRRDRAGDGGWILVRTFEMFCSLNGWDIVRYCDRVQHCWCCVHRCFRRVLHNTLCSSAWREQMRTLSSGTPVLAIRHSFVSRGRCCVLATTPSALGFMVKHVHQCTY